MNFTMLYTLYWVILSFLLRVVPTFFRGSPGIAWIPSTTRCWIQPLLLKSSRRAVGSGGVYDSVPWGSLKHAEKHGIVDAKMTIFG